MKSYNLLLLMLALSACEPALEQNTHQAPTHNFSVQRLIILNANDECLMVSEQSVWAPPSFLFNERQYVKEGLDSLANAYGLKISRPQLRGQFSFKYDYHPYATLRNYYVAHYISGEIQIPDDMDDAKWIPIPQAIEQNTVTAIREISGQIIKYPDVVWGGSFEVSHVGDEHPTKMVEMFYPLFGTELGEK